MFQIFFFVYVCGNCNPSLKKVNPLFPSNPLLKVEVLSSPPFGKFGWRFNPSSSRKGGGVHSMFSLWLVLLLISFLLLLFRIALFKLVSTSFFYCKEFYIGVIVAPCAQCLCNFVFSFVCCDRMFHSM